jgi:hypothetical protein
MLGKCFRSNGRRYNSAALLEFGSIIADMQQMISRRFLSATLVSVLFAAAGLVFAHPAPRKASNRSHVVDFARAGQLPAVMLWAWERPEDLSGIDSSRVGVAFLACTVFLGEWRTLPSPWFPQLTSSTAE